MAEHSDSLSPNQLEKVMEFQELTGCMDVCACVPLLKEANWSVEQAVHKHLTQESGGGDEASIPPQEPSSSGTSDGVRHRGGGPATSGQPSTGAVPGASTSSPQSSSVVATGSMLQRLGSWLYWAGIVLPMRLILKGPARLLYVTYSCLYSLYSATAAPDPVGDMDQFLREYAAQYPGVAHPTFHRSSYTQALQTAKQQLRFLMIYLHCKDHANTHRFCREVLADPRLLDHITQNNILVWACDVYLPEGYRVSQALRENTYPYVAVSVVRNNRMSIVGRLDGNTLLSVDALLAALGTCQRANELHLTQARLNRQEREQAVALRQEQDSAYEASLRADREKAKRKEVELQQQKQQVQRLELLQQQHLQRIEDLRAMVPTEPDACSPDALPLLVKLPCGTRLERRFRGNEPLTALYCYLASHKDVPDRFEVTTNFPRKVVPCCAPTLLVDPLSSTPIEVDNASSTMADNTSTSIASPSSILSVDKVESAHSTVDEDKNKVDESTLTFVQFGLLPRTVLFVKDMDA